MGLNGFIALGVRQDWATHMIGLEQTGMIQEIIQNTRFFLIDFLHGFQTADFVFQPFQHQHRHINGITRRRVVHGTVVSMDLIIQHSGGNIPRFTN